MGLKSGAMTAWVGKEGISGMLGAEVQVEDRAEFRDGMGVRKRVGVKDAVEVRDGAEVRVGIRERARVEGGG